MLGLQIAKVVQTAIHNDETDPGGWKYQISNGGEPTANYSFRFKWLAAARLAHGGARRWTGRGRPRRSQGRPPCGRHLRRGGEPRHVHERLRRRACPPRPHRLALLGARPAARRLHEEARRCSAPHHPRGLRLGVVRYELWAYNALLQGQFRSSPVTLTFHPASTDPNLASPMNRNVWNVAAGRQYAGAAVRSPTSTRDTARSSRVLTADGTRTGASTSPFRTRTCSRDVRLDHLGMRACRPVTTSAIRRSSSRAIGPRLAASSLCRCRCSPDRSGRPREHVAARLESLQRGSSTTVAAGFWKTTAKAGSRERAASGESSRRTR